MNLNDDVVYRCLRLGPLRQLHPGRSRSLVRYHDRLHHLPPGVWDFVIFRIPLQMRENRTAKIDGPMTFGYRIDATDSHELVDVVVAQAGGRVVVLGGANGTTMTNAVIECILSRKSAAPSRHPPGLQTKARPWICACCAQPRRPAVALTEPVWMCAETITTIQKATTPLALAEARGRLSERLRRRNRSSNGHWRINEHRLHQALGYRAPLAVFRAGSAAGTCDMWPTRPQPAQPESAHARRRRPLPIFPPCRYPRD
jgi:hypothetical protein